MEGDVRRGPWWVLCVLGSACAQIVTGPSAGDAAPWVGALPPDDAGEAPMAPADACDPGVARSASTWLARCGVGDRAAADTFSCTGGSDPALRCAANTQYCEQTNDGSTTTDARCLALPVSCFDNPCNTCLVRGTQEIVGCLSSRVGPSRSTTVTVRR